MGEKLEIDRNVDIFKGLVMTRRDTNQKKTVSRLYRLSMSRRERSLRLIGMSIFLRICGRNSWGLTLIHRLLRFLLVFCLYVYLYICMYITCTYGIYIICILIYMHVRISWLWMWVYFTDMWPQLEGFYSDSSPVALSPGILFIRTYGIYIICTYMYMNVHISWLWRWVYFKDMWLQLVGSSSDSSPVGFHPGILFMCIFIYMYVHISWLWMWVCFNDVCPQLVHTV